MDVKKVEKSVDVFDKFQDCVMEYIERLNYYNAYYNDCNYDGDDEYMTELAEDIIDLLPVIRSRFPAIGTDKPFIPKVVEFRKMICSLDNGIRPNPDIYRDTNEDYYSGLGDKTPDLTDFEEDTLDLTDITIFEDVV